MSGRLRVALRLAFSLALLAFVVWRARIGEVGTVLAGVSFPWLAAAAALLAINPWLCVLRWRTLIAVHGRPPTMFFLFRAYLYGIFLNNFLPATVGVDAFRATQVPRSSLPLSASLVTVVVERIVGLVGLSVVALLFFPAVAGRFSITVPWLPLAAGTLAVLFLLWRLASSPGLLPGLRSAASRHPWLAGPVSLAGRILSPLREFLAAPRPLAVALLFSIAIHVNLVLFMTCLARSLAIGIPLPAMLGIIPLTRLVTSLPLTINGIGLREGSLAFFLGAWHVPTAGAVAVAWLDYGFVLAAGFAGWLLWAFTRPGGETPRHAPHRDCP